MNMTENTIDEVLKPFFVIKGMDYKSFPKTESLVKVGVIDSIAFVNLLLELEIALNKTLDFANADVADLVSINGLYKLFAQD